MKSLPFPVLPAALLMCFVAGCEEKPVVMAPAVPVKAKARPKVYQAPDPRVEAADRAQAMEKEIASLEAEAEKMRQEIGLEQNALDRAMLEEERFQLEQDRAAWLEEQAAAAIRDKKSSAETALAPAAPPQDYSFFYNELSSSGRWFESVDYGYVWQPAVAASRDWRPYTAGRWASSGVGWTWVSEEPFGWATYHYGRWARVKGCGWIWVPGDTWAPAWVAWRQSDQYIGWCPLPPETLYHGNIVYDGGTDQRYGINPACYIFIGIKNFCRPVLPHCEPASRSPEVCRKTTNITRLEVAGSRVDHSGPKYEWIKNRLAGVPARYNLTFEPRPGQDHRPRLEGDRLCVFSPTMRAPWNASLRPPVVAGPLSAAKLVIEDVAPPAKTQARFRDEKQAWLAAAAQRLKSGPGEVLTERQGRIAALEAKVSGTAGSVPASPPSPLRRPDPAVAPSPDGPSADDLVERQAHREEVLKKVRERQADLAGLRNEALAVKPRALPVTPVDPPAVPAAVAGIRGERPIRPDQTAGPVSGAPRPGPGETILVSPPLAEVEKPRPGPVGVAPAAPASVVHGARPETGEGPSGRPATAGVIQNSPAVEPAALAPGEPPVTPAAHPDVSPELVARREKALQRKAELAARQQAMEQKRQEAAGSPQAVTPAEKTQETPVPPTVQEAVRQADPVAVPDEMAALAEQKAAQEARRAQAEQAKEALAARQEALRQQREAAALQEPQAAPPAPQAVPDSIALAEQRAALEARRAQAEQAKEALAARQEALRQQRETAALQARQAEQAATLAAAARQEQLERQAAVAADQQQKAQQAESASQPEQDRQDRAANQAQEAAQQREVAQQAAAARQAAVVQEQRQQQQQQQQQQAALAETARQQQLEKQAELRAQQEAAQRAMAEQAAAQQQREAGARQRQVAEEAARQQEIARQQEMQRQAELQLRQAEQRARQEEAARQQQIQREAEQRQRQEEAARQQQQEREAEQRQRQEEAARQQQQQRDAEERQRQENQRARQEAAARAAEEAAKKGQ